VFILDHHEAYIPWEQYEANQAKIAENRASREVGENRGAIRKGPTLMAGLLRCGHCGRKLRVSYSTRAATYVCDEGSTAAFKRCLSIGTRGLDRAVSEHLCQALEREAVDAAIEAEAQHARDHEHVVAEAELRVQAAKYEANRAMEQFDQVDPKNRLVADTLEERLDQRLKDHKAAEKHMREVDDAHKPLTEQERASLDQLAANFPALWNDPTVDQVLRKKIARTAIEEAIVTHHPEDECMQVIVHWKGGVHTRVHVHKRQVLRGSKAAPKLVETVQELARAGVQDMETARALNLNGMQTPRGLMWTQERVTRFRKHHQVVLQPKDPDALSAQQAARYLDTSRSSIEGLAELGLLDKNQVLPYAPWCIAKRELDSEPVRTALQRLRATGKLAARRGCSDDQLALFPQEAPETSEVQE